MTIIYKDLAGTEKVLRNVGKIEFRTTDFEVTDSKHNGKLILKPDELLTIID